MTHSFDSDWHEHEHESPQGFMNTTTHSHASDDSMGHRHPGLKPKVKPSRLSEVIDRARRNADE